MEFENKCIAIVWRFVCIVTLGLLAVLVIPFWLGFAVGVWWRAFRWVSGS